MGDEVSWREEDMTGKKWEMNKRRIKGYSRDTGYGGKRR